MSPTRVLVANRGEIARRLIRGLKRLRYETVAVHSEPDANAPHVAIADYAFALGGTTATESYLRIDRILEACRATGANAVHPGYGFLSENAEFAAAVEAAGIVFVGPRADSIQLMGDKTAAIATARAAGVPTVPSYTPPTPDTAPDEIAREAKKLGLPLMIKAAAGGGGKGMRIAHDASELAELVPAAVREAKSAFGDGRIFLERYVNPARHVEVQVLGDGDGGAVVFGERDCSVQRRHQKLVEEAPAPNLSDSTRTALHDAARGLVESTKYRGAGTVEFILAEDESFFFLEMNTRLQVEHPVTECVFGVDLLALQMEVAARRGIPASCQGIAPRGHAIEVRVYAEDAAGGFLPSTGDLIEVTWPSGPGVRVDSGVETGHAVTLHYDPMLAKVIAWDTDRERAIDAMRQALGETFIAGVKTTVGFCRDLIDHPAFREAKLSTGFIPDHFAEWKGAPPDDAWTRAAIAMAPRLLGHLPSQSGAEETIPLAWESLTDWRMA